MVASSRGRLVMALVLGLVLAASLLVWRVSTAPVHVRVEDAMVTVPTGPRGAQRVQLDTRWYVPATASARAPAPAVLLAHGFGGTKESVADQARYLAEQGYVVLTWTAQGFGRSGGQIHLMDPDYEVSDARRLLDLLARRSDVLRDGPGDPRVGVVGSSYGGALALLLAGLDKRVDAIVPQATWNDLGRALFPEATGKGPREGVFKRAWASWLYAAGLGRSVPDLDPATVRSSVPESTDTADLASGSRDGSPDEAVAGRARSSTATAFLPELARVLTDTAACGRFALEVCRMYHRVAATGRADAATVRLLRRSSPAAVLDRITAPTLLIQGTADTLFPLAEAEANAVGIAANGTPVRVLWFSGGHDAGPGSTLDRRRIRNATRTWLDHYVRGSGPKPPRSFAFTRVTSTGELGYDVATLGLYTRRYPGLDGDQPPRVVSLTGHPSTISSPPKAGPAALSSMPGLGIVTRSPLARAFVHDIPGQAVAYESAPLSTPVDVVGAPTVRLQAASPTGSAVLFVKLYDVAPDGGATLPGGNVAAVRLTGLPTSYAEARPVTVTLPGLVHRFPTGHRIRVTVAAADQAYAGPESPQVYVAGLADAAIELPRVRARTPSDPAAPWLAALAALAGLCALGVVGAFLVGRHGRSRRERLVDAGHADTPLVVRGLAKTYGRDHVVLRGVDFTVRRGQVVGLLGPNGAGKTTCLRILHGLVRPTAGEVLVFGQRVVPGASVLSRVGVLVESPGFLPHLSGRANLELFWRATGRPLEEARMPEVLEIAGLGAALDRRVREYSHGMRQRLAIAQAMLGMPDLLILDEPTDGLDPPQIAGLRRVLRQYAATGRAVLVSSHLLAEVELTCTHVVVLHEGRRVAAGPVADVAGDQGTVEVEVTDVERAASLVSTLPVASVARRERDLVVVLNGVARSEVVRTLVTGGVGVERVGPRGRLEDRFLALVGQDGPERIGDRP
ncbi:alpha/beta fold hydrolase [Thermasporomyces composti]|nr:alpha/beta fold hydrolase [Thermasporomyces composti]